MRKGEIWPTWRLSIISHSLKIFPSDGSRTHRLDLHASFQLQLKISRIRRMQVQQLTCQFQVLSLTQVLGNYIPTYTFAF